MEFNLTPANDELQLDQRSFIDNIPDAQELVSSWEEQEFLRENQFKDAKERRRENSLQMALIDLKHEKEKEFYSASLVSTNMNKSDCQTCKHVTLHEEWAELPDHFTCLCLLFECRSICCEIGFENLIKNMPSLAVLLKREYFIPSKLNYDCFFAWQKKKNVTEISEKRMALIDKRCVEIIEKYARYPCRFGIQYSSMVELKDDPFYF